MPGPKPKYSIQLLDNQIIALQHLVRSHKVPQAQVMRARIVLAAHEHPEWSNQQIAYEVGCADRIVLKWRKRWVETQCLEDLPRPGTPKHFFPEVRAQATALACSLPKEHGRASSRWSLAEIIAQLIALEAVVSLAPSTLWRWLTSEKLKPWRYHNWQHILHPQAFLEWARPVLEVYAHAQQMLREGVWAVCG